MNKTHIDDIPQEKLERALGQRGEHLEAATANALELFYEP